jgi:hypothetical protein
MTVNYHMTVEKYPNLNGRVGSSMPGNETFSLLDGKTKSSLIAR